MFLHLTVPARQLCELTLFVSIPSHAKQAFIGLQIDGIVFLRCMYLTAVLTRILTIKATFGKAGDKSQPLAQSLYRMIIGR